MSPKKIVVLSLFCILSVYAFSNSYAYERNAAKSENTAALTHEVQTKHLSGIELWIIQIYKGHRLLYAVIVTFVMAAMGVTLAFFADLVLKALGLEATKISHRE